MSMTPEEFMRSLAGRRVYATVMLGLVATLYQGVLTKDLIPPARWHLVPDDADSPLLRVILFIEDGECQFELQAGIACLVVSLGTQRLTISAETPVEAGARALRQAVGEHHA